MTDFPTLLYTSTCEIPPPPREETFACNHSIKMFKCNQIFCSLQPFFCIRENFFQSFLPYKIFVIVLHNSIGLDNFPLSFSPS